MANALSARLNKAYGDPNLSGAIHPHRAPRFREPQMGRGSPCAKVPTRGRQLPRGQSGLCRALHLHQGAGVGPGDRPATSGDTRQAGERGRAPTPIGTLPSEVYAAHHRDIMARWRGDKPNLSIVDSMIAERMVATGHDEDSVRHAIEACAPSIHAQGRRAGTGPTTRGAQRSTRLTAPRPLRASRSCGRTSGQVLLLEGRDPAELTHAEPR